MNRPDSELLMRLQRGDLAAFDALVERYERRLIGYFRSQGSDRQMAEDCAQEVFMRVFRAREAYSPDAAPSTFIFRIARNYWIDVFRSKRARPAERSLEPSADDSDAGLPAVADLVAGEVPAPPVEVVDQEDKERLRAALLRLPESQRSVLSLAGGQGLKYEQVAEVLGIPVGTVKSRVHAAVSNLRRLLGVEEPKRK